MKLFSFNKKEKISIEKLSKIYSNTIFEVVDKGFPEIIGFVNDNRKFEESPNLKTSDIKWFLMIIFVANNYRLSNFLKSEIVDKLHNSFAEEVVVYFSDDEPEIIRDMILDYEAFFNEQLKEANSIEKAMARSIFIKYNLNDNSYVNVSIYNVAGELVKTLFNGPQNKGKNSLIWNAKNNKNESVVGGLYIYSVNTENNIYSRKMMLLK